MYPCQRIAIKEIDYLSNMTMCGERVLTTKCRAANRGTGFLLKNLEPMPSDDWIENRVINLLCKGCEGEE